MRLSRLRWSIALCTVPLGALLAGPLYAQAPAVSGLSPLALSPGGATNLTLTGANLAAPTAIWTSITAEASLAPDVDKNGTLADKVVYRFTLAADVPVGIAALRLATGKGVSSVRLVMIDDLKSAADSGNNHTVETAQEASGPVAIDGATDNLQNDFYKLSAKAGQMLSVEVVAGRLGSVLDPTIRLLDAQGRELIYSDDEPGIGGDCRFRFRIPADGVYTLELRDVRYQGGAGHFYRLRIGDFPFASVAYPMGVQAGTSATLAAAGSAVDGAAPVSFTASPDRAGDAVPVNFKFPNGQGSAFATVLIARGREIAETEPNDDPASAPTVQMATELPAALNGRFDKPGDRDVFS
ncbi:MAG: PPC domain-containing protein, partial [Pirellulales bacterium]